MSDKANDKDAKKPTNEVVDHAVIRSLAGLLTETGLSEIEVERGGTRIRVSRQVMAAAPAAMAPPHAAGPAPAAARDTPPAPAVPEAVHPGTVRSPMVGTAYRGADPAAKPFVEVGDQVKAGDTLLIIEAMKTMNTIPAPRAGKVIKVMFEDGQPVEYDEPLLIVE